MQNNSDSRQCRICHYLNDPKAENCAQCGAIIETKSREFKSRPAPTRERFAVNAEPEKGSKKQSLKIWACLIIVAAASGIIGYQIYKSKEPVRAIRPQQQVVVQSDEGSEMSAKAPVKSKTAEEIGAKPLDIEKEKESISKEYREVGGDEGCSTEYTFNRFGQRVPVPPSPDKPLTIHGIIVGVYYEKIENFALAEAGFDIDRTWVRDFSIGNINPTASSRASPI
jgi:hypothetical protein